MRLTFLIKPLTIGYTNIKSGITNYTCRGGIAMKISHIDPDRVSVPLRVDQGQVRTGGALLTVRLLRIWQGSPRLTIQDN